MHLSVEERAVGEHYTAGFHRSSEQGAHTGYCPILNQQFSHNVLPYLQVIGAREAVYPFFDKTFPIALTARAPHGWPFLPIEHAELDSGLIGDDAELSSERIDLSYDLSFGYTTYGRVTTHLTNLIHIDGDE